MGNPFCTSETIGATDKCVTGTGCMLGALCVTYLSVSRNIDAVAIACVVLAISGQLAETPKGSGSFMVAVLDTLSTLSNKDIINLINMGKRALKNFDTRLYFITGSNGYTEEFLFRVEQKDMTLKPPYKELRITYPAYLPQCSILVRNPDL